MEQQYNRDVKIKKKPALASSTDQDPDHLTLPTLFLSRFLPHTPARTYTPVHHTFSLLSLSFSSFFQPSSLSTSHVSLLNVSMGEKKRAYRDQRIHVGFCDAASVL